MLTHLFEKERTHHQFLNHVFWLSLEIEIRSSKVWKPQFHLKRFLFLEKKPNNCHSTIEKIESSINIIIHQPTLVGKYVGKIIPLTTKTIINSSRKVTQVTKHKKQFTALLRIRKKGIDEIWSPFSEWPLIPFANIFLD